MPDGKGEKDQYDKFAEAYGMSRRAAIETIGRFQAEPQSEEWANLTAMERAALQATTSVDKDTFSEEPPIATAKVTPERPFLPFPEGVEFPPPKPELAWRARPPEYGTYPESWPAAEVEAQKGKEALQEGNQKALFDFQEQMREWKLARRGFQYDWATGKTIKGEPVATSLPEMPPEIKDLINPEFVAWYEGMAKPVGTGETASEVAGKYRDKPVREIPDYFDTFTPEEKAMWASANGYGAVYIDKEGNILSWADVQRVAQTNPNMEINQSFFLGGNSVIDIGPYNPGELSGPAQTAPGVAPWGETEKIGAELAQKEAEILDGVTIENYGQKVAQLMNLYQAPNSGWRGTNAYYDALNRVESRMSPEDKAKLGEQGEHDRQLQPKVQQPLWRNWMAKTGLSISFKEWMQQYYGGELPKKSEAKGVAIDADVLSKYGISVLDNYPYISPVSQAQLSKIPISVLEQMAAYLREKGISWSDFVSVGQSYYGGGGGAGGRWAIPTQWG